MAGSPGSVKFFLRGFSIILAIIVAESARLNVPRVLLPFSDTPPKYQLSADGGCYKWSSNRPDIINIKQTSECSSSVGISVVSRTGQKGSVGVLAEDTDSGLVLRADVIVDKIHSLRIVTKTHELYKEETPEKFEVRAYDEQGNEFSTVEGMVFKWNIEAGRTGAEILRFIPWADSPYNTETVLETLETEGKQGNKVLLEGIKTGSAKVTVKLVDTLNPTVPATSESLMVVANLFLVPAVAYILPGAQLKYAANQFRGSRVLQVALPSAHHILAVNQDLASLNQQTATLTGLHIGNGQVELLDQNVDAGEIVKTPTADLFVVSPARLEISCLPFKSWSVLVGHPYLLQVEIFDKDGNKIFLSDNIVIDLAYDQSYFKITNSVDNGTFHDIVPGLAGQTEVTAILRGVNVDGKLVPLKAPISASGTLEIFDGMTLDPAHVVIPWDPTKGASYSMQYKVKGGSAPYMWASSNNKIGTVSQLGVGSLLSNSIGDSKISAAMTRAAHNKAQGTVSVEPAVSLSFMDSELEFLVGSEIVLPVGLYHTHKQMFTRCDKVPYSMTVSDSTVFSTQLQSSANQGCASLILVGSKLSHTKVSIEFSYAMPESKKKIVLEDIKTVATYSPLSHIFPASGETVIAVESSVQIVWTGGPQPWPLDPSNHFRTLTKDQENIVRVSTVKEGGGVYVYKAVCLALGETSVTLSVGNKASSTLPKPVVSTSTVKIICGTPASIHLTPEINGPTGLPPCPASARAGRIATQAYRNLDIGVTIKDGQGRIFDGVESVTLDWKISDNGLAKLGSSSGVLRTKQVDWLVQPTRPYQTLLVNSRTGNLDVSVSLPKTGFLASSAGSDQVLLNLVQDAGIEPESVTIFHHNKKQAVAAAVQGSGYFKLNVQHEGVAVANYQPENRSISVTPTKPGTTNIILKDLCLSAEKVAQTSLTIRGVVRVELDVIDKIEQGKEVTGTVRLYAANNKLLEDDILQYVSLSLTTPADIVSVGDVTGLSPVISGSKLGVTTVTATVSYHGIKVSSSPASIEVFPPLRIEPRNITLIIGAAFQVLTTGGPTDALIQYFLSDEDIGEVSSDGLVTGGTLGSTKLIGRAVGKSSSGGVLEYTRDSVLVHVVPLSAIRLEAATKKIVIDGSVPIYLLGQDDNINSYSILSAVPHLHISWSVKGLVEGGRLVTTQDSTGLKLSHNNAGVAIFKGVSAGKSVVSVTVKISSKSRGSQFQLLQDRELTATLELMVVDRLEAKLPVSCLNHVLVSPEASLLLVTNKNEKTVYSIVGESSGLSVSRRGLITAPRNTGTTVVLGSVTEDGGVRQQTSWVVEVVPVHFITLESTHSTWTLAQDAEYLPRGANLDIKVNCFDVLGRRLNACPVDLISRPSRFDLIKMVPASNNSFSLTTQGNGYTVLRVQDRLSGKVAWSILQVGEAVLAPQTTAQGDVVDFDLMIKHTGEGKWSADPSGILDITGKTGSVVGSGLARVKYTTPDDGVFFTDVLVKGADHIEIGETTTLWPSPSPIQILVKFGSDSQVSSSALSEKNVDPKNMFNCKASWELGPIEQVFSVTPRLTADGWSCEFTCISKNAPTKPLRVSLVVESVQGGLVGEKTLFFFPTFNVNTLNLEIGPDGGSLLVSGHFEVLRELKSIGEGVHVGSAWLEEDMFKLPVHLKFPIVKEPTVSIICKLTGQEIKVVVQPTFRLSGQSSGFLSDIFRDIMVHYQTVLTCLVLVALSIYLLRPGTKPPPAPAPPPAKPVDSPSASPSPQPYLWTQDNSPIYGSPIYRRSPQSQARNLTQYSYS